MISMVHSLIWSMLYDLSYFYIAALSTFFDFYTILRLPGRDNSPEREKQAY